MKTGILGGTLDPIHSGHLVVAEEVTASLSLDEVVFIPAGQPWIKAGNHISAAEHRLKMVELAIAGKPYFKVSTIELERPGATYSVDTIEQLKQQADAADELYFIIGWDNLIELPRWHRPQRLIELCRLVAVPRVGCSPPDLELLEKSLPGISQKVIMLVKPQINISASLIRERVAKRLSIAHLVPSAVEGYIRQQGLYWD